MKTYKTYLGSVTLNDLNLINSFQGYQIIITLTFNNETFDFYRNTVDTFLIENVEVLKSKEDKRKYLLSYLKNEISDTVNDVIYN